MFRLERKYPLFKSKHLQMTKKEIIKVIDSILLKDVLSEEDQKNLLECKDSILRGETVKGLIKAGLDIIKYLLVERLEGP